MGGWATLGVIFGVILEACNDAGAAQCLWGQSPQYMHHTGPAKKPFLALQPIPELTGPSFALKLKFKKPKSRKTTYMKSA